MIAGVLNTGIGFYFMSVFNVTIGVVCLAVGVAIGVCSYREGI